MKIFILKLIPPFNPGYDVTQGLLIRAESEGDARAMADQKTRAEYGRPRHRPWMDTRLASCAEMTSEGAAEIVMMDYQAG
ncbi:hypothetical protein SAMN04487867_12972 [Vreelandella titanicae]|uniref:hypothetical protein n=1 Tax=Vreelandella titanicae TaxID=664683 RepID=UPI00088F8477|nr:hypothetical protein [Halomonas titanicae]SDJ24272.1 hypothetical protein SAMN04487867_12972 [Halomonas titanicae]